MEPLLVKFTGTLGHMNVSLLIRNRLSELGHDQKALASEAQVTESYVSQLLRGKKPPPAPGRTDIYEKIEGFLQLPQGELARVAEIQRQEELRKRISDPPKPLFKEVRDLILRKCQSSVRPDVRRIFEKEPWGELEHLITRTLLDVAQGIAREELRSEEWLRLMAQLSGRSYEQMRVAVLELLDSDVLHISVESCLSFLEPMIDSWNIELATFRMEVVLNRRLAPVRVKRFEYAEQAPKTPLTIEPGFEQFLNDRTLSGDVTEMELEFLKQLQFLGRRPTALYYYRELQNLRDPLHFTTAAPSPEQSPKLADINERNTP